MDPITAALVELGPLGVFAGFLVWQHHRLQKRADEWQASHQAEVDKVRDRYDKILAMKDARFERLTGKIETTLDLIYAQVKEQS